MDEHIFDWILENVPWKVISRRKERLAQRLVLGKIMKSASPGSVSPQLACAVSTGWPQAAGRPAGASLCRASPCRVVSPAFRCLFSLERVISAPCLLNVF